PYKGRHSSIRTRPQPVLPEDVGRIHVRHVDDERSLLLVIRPGNRAHLDVEVELREWADEWWIIERTWSGARFVDVDVRRHHAAHQKNVLVHMRGEQFIPAGHIAREQQGK